MNSPLRFKSACCPAAIRVLLCLFALILLVGAQSASAQSFSGSIFTSFNDGTTVNGNLYPSKDAVYLNGGPQNKNSNGLPDGVYYFQVTDPSGGTLLSADDVTCREVLVSGGVFAGPTGPCPHNAGGVPPGTPNPANNSISVQLCAPAGCPAGSPDFSDTPNPGGEYKVWLTPVCSSLPNPSPGANCYDAANAANGCRSGGECWGFPDSASKTDNFKVEPQQCTTCTNSASLTVCKFQDSNDNGIHDGSEALLDGWTIHAVNVDGLGGSKDQVTGDSVPGSGCTTFAITGFPDANTVETVTLTEVIPPNSNWNETAPLAGTYPGGSGGSVTVTGCSVIGTPAPIPACTATISVPLKVGDNVVAPDFGNTGFDLSISKTANPSFTRTYNWTITKSANPTLVEQIGGNATINYTVTVAQDPTNPFTDSAWTVSGQITVSNSNGFAVTGVNVTDDDSADGGTCSVTGGTGVTVPANGSISLNYSCTYTKNPGSGTNSAQATWDASTFHTPDGSASTTQGFTFGAPTNLVNQTVNVTDCFKGPCPPAALTTLGTAGPATNSAPFASTTFNYQRTIPVPAFNCTTFPNTATIVQTGQTANASVEICGPAKTGALTMGFWQNKNGQNIILSFSGTNCQALRTWLNGFHPFSDLTATSCGSSPSLGAKSASGVVGYVYTIIKNATCSGPSTSPCNAMLKAQMLATALDVYFSDPTLGGNRIGAPGPIGAVSIDLSKVCNMIDGSGGTASCSGTFSNVASLFGVTKCATVMTMLIYQNTSDPLADGGAVWYGNVKASQVGAKNAFDAINNQVAFPCP